MADFGEGLVLDVAWCRSRQVAAHIAAVLDAHERARSDQDLAELRCLLGHD